MRIALINGSPKKKTSASAGLLNDLSNLLNEEKLLWVDLSQAAMKEDVMHQILKCDALVFAFQLNVEGIPSQLLTVLESMETYLHNNQELMNGEKEAMVYTMVNCGFYENKQCSIAIDLMERFARRVGFRFGQGSGFGIGGLLAWIAGVPTSRSAKEDYEIALMDMAENIKNKKSGETLYPNMSFPRFLYGKVTQLVRRQGNCL